MSYLYHHLTTPVGSPLGAPVARWASNSLPEDHWDALVYAFRFWDKANYARLTKSYQAKKIEIVQVLGISYSGGDRRQAMLATTVLFVVTALLALLAAAL